jgi:hypothetical protein
VDRSGCKKSAGGAEQKMLDFFHAAGVSKTDFEFLWTRKKPI